MKVNVDEFCPCSEYSKITRRRETCPINFINSAGTSTDLHGNVNKQCMQTVNWRIRINIPFKHDGLTCVCAYKPNG